MRNANWTRIAETTLSMLVVLLVVSPRAAATQNFKVSGTLASGGVFSGTLSIDTVNGAANCQPTQPCGAVTAWNINVVPAQLPGFDFTPSNSSFFFEPLQPGCPASELSWGAPGVAAFGLIIPYVTLIGFTGSPLIPQIQCGGVLDISNYAVIGAADFLVGGSITPLCQVNVPAPAPISSPAASHCPPPSGGATGRWYELDKTWAGCHYDNANPPLNTIGDQGCALTALAACLAFVGPDYDPESLNLILDGITGAYSAPTLNVPNSGGAITFTTAVSGASRGTLSFDMSQRISTQSILPGQSSPVLDSYLCGPSPKPVMVQVYNPRTRNQHYVVVTGKDSLNNYSIIDPGYRTVDSLSTYGNQFEVAGVVKKANGDPSALDFTVVDTATLLVMAPDGSKTGFDPVSGQVLKGLPQSAYFAQDNSIDTDAEVVDATSVAYSVEYSFPPDGTYTIQLIGLQSGAYQLAINAFDANGAHENYIVKPGVATEGSSSSFQIKFSSVPGSATTVTRTATFASALADITNSLALGLINNAVIANALSNKIHEAASAVAEHESDDAREILKAFKNQVSAETGTHITGVAPQVLQEDADSLISQLP